MGEMSTTVIGSEFVGGGVAGFFMGWALRKAVNVVKKLVMAIVGFQVFTLAFLESKGLIDVKWDAINSFFTSLVSGGSGAGGVGAAASDAAMQVFNAMMSFVPATGGMALGVMVGWKKGA